ncbi:hypothetical protein [Acidicapsa acidisoli]|uniref:hypothetical protein n=1 Tax=Acidicapsa acidisoli TaxID=1615681 RepID=UPI0021E0C496|nr:hypothetical protein [Acidicapsa acidisoli]
MQNILVLFEATQEDTEGLALAIGLGSVHQGANIRLRHLDPQPTAQLAHKSYGRLKADDLRWAEGIAVVLETGSSEALGEIEQCLLLLSKAGSPFSKVAYVFGGDAEQKSVSHLHGALQRAGFQLLSQQPANQVVTPAFMTQIGERLAEEKI